MWTAISPIGWMFADRPNQDGGSARRTGASIGRHTRLEALENRDLLSVGGNSHLSLLRASLTAEIRTISPEISRMANHSLIASPAKRVAKQANFSLAQVEKLLPGQWYVQYDASSLFGPGAIGAQQITFTGPEGSPTFISTTGVKVQGFFAPAYYQFSSWGTYQFLSKKLVRLTITGGSPTEYLNNGIIVMGGQFMPIQFVNKNEFIVQGQTYNRVPLPT